MFCYHFSLQCIIRQPLNVELVTLKLAISLASFSPSEISDSEVFSTAHVQGNPKISGFY